MITGSNSGLGKSTAEAIARRGSIQIFMAKIDFKGYKLYFWIFRR